MIKPTNGRVVWFYARPDVDQPEAAHVCWVHSDRMINVLVINPHGVTRGEQSVFLVQDDNDLDEAIKSDGRFARWMPYQVGQARQNTVRGDLEENTSSAVAQAPSEDQETERAVRLRRGWLGIEARPRVSQQKNEVAGQVSLRETILGEGRIIGRVD